MVIFIMAIQSGWAIRQRSREYAGGKAEILEAFGQFAGQNDVDQLGALHSGHDSDLRFLGFERNPALACLSVETRT
jgi:hypothetical protein